MPQVPPASIAGYSFENPALLRQALTHRSYSSAHNERLEFLGDAVLNCVIAAELFRIYPAMPEGDLSRVRASLVNGQTLCGLAAELGIGARLSLGEGELRSGGAQRPSILANAVEALIGAVFLDGGFPAAQTFTLKVFEYALKTLDPRVAGKDAKTLLQELLQARHLSLPRYAVIATDGDAHEQSFRVECCVEELDVRTEGAGASRRAAEQLAAKQAYDLIARG
ncbi:MAG: ribonuclease III [Betaproteobacteria bacterium]|jgi:ribonuclease-3|nr:ribonuclease III [Betaproteobacteria bacterium]